MSISSVSSGSSHLAQVQLQPRAHVERAGEKENDGDRDDVAVAAAAKAGPGPTINDKGQTVGSIISVMA